MIPPIHKTFIYQTYIIILNGFRSFPIYVLRGVSTGGEYPFILSSSTLGISCLEIPFLRALTPFFTFGFLRGWNVPSGFRVFGVSGSFGHLGISGKRMGYIRSGGVWFREPHIWFWHLFRYIYSRQFHLIIPGNHKTEFRNPRLNSRPLLPFNQSGFHRIRGVVKHNGSHQHVL